MSPVLRFPTQPFATPNPNQELTLDMLHLLVYCAFFAVVFSTYGIPLHLVRCGSRRSAQAVVDAAACRSMPVLPPCSCVQHAVSHLPKPLFGLQVRDLYWTFRSLSFLPLLRLAKLTESHVLCSTLCRCGTCTGPSATSTSACATSCATAASQVRALHAYSMLG